jgi:hypothetical protein
MSEDSSLQVISPETELSDPVFEEGWEELVQEFGSPYGMYASPDWILHILETSGNPVRVWKVRDSSGKLQGVVPLEISQYSLPFQAANRNLATISLRTAHVLGGVPPLPKDPAVHLRFLDAAFSDLPECDSLHCDLVPWDSWFSKFLREDQEVRKRYIVHSPFGVRKWHLLRVDGPFEDYMGTLSSKSRHNLRRNVKRLRKRADTFELKRVDRPDQVCEFLRHAVEVSKHSWQHRELGERIADDEETRNSMVSLANRGLLRCYVLFSGDEACAFSTAYQRRGVVNCHELGFDQRLSPFSPGKVLIFLMIEDVHVDPDVTLLNFGMGEAEYKRKLSNIETAESSWLIMRRSIRNRILVKSHAMLDGTVELLKKIARRNGKTGKS